MNIDYINLPSPNYKTIYSSLQSVTGVEYSSFKSKSIKIFFKKLIYYKTEVEIIASTWKSDMRKNGQKLKFRNLEYILYLKELMSVLTNL